ncbi:MULTISPECIES: hypothetical protein [unclassified Sphingomonas]|uniref:hypothetical protein n=1 Tax=Sphingomonas TaxID=13687 RepID=UPI00095E8C1D|nr:MULTISPECIES: hypothetical protein [unclassified Sphingomonas]OJY48025.1 MAG: hypothetical protein BGP17_02440 [Sphingomonas sp. 67-41]
MKTINMSAAVIAVALSTFAIAAPAFAQDAPVTNTRGHYEWRSVPQYGPHPTGPTRVRVWVPEAREMASCDCAMMQASPADCMKGAVKPNNG